MVAKCRGLYLTSRACMLPLLQFQPDDARPTSIFRYHTCTTFFCTSYSAQTNITQPLPHAERPRGSRRACQSAAFALASMPSGTGIRHRLFRIGGPRSDRLSAGHRYGHGAFRRKILHCGNLFPERQQRRWRRPNGCRPATRGAVRSPRGLQPSQLAGPASRHRGLRALGQRERERRSGHVLGRPVACVRRRLVRYRLERRKSWAV